ncbi:hypothetical protein NKG05_22535 [Oerskovia sp. M15]
MTWPSMSTGSTPAPDGERHDLHRGPRRVRLVRQHGTPARPHGHDGGDEQTEIALDVKVSHRCLAGRAYLSVTATNASTVPAHVKLSTPFGGRSFAGVPRERWRTSRSPSGARCWRPGRSRSRPWPRSTARRCRRRS